MTHEQGKSTTMSKQLTNTVVLTQHSNVHSGLCKCSHYIHDDQMNISY